MRFKDLRGILKGEVIVTMLFRQEAHIIDVEASELDILNDMEVVSVRSTNYNGYHNQATLVTLDGEDIYHKFCELGELFDIFEEVSLW